MIHTRTELDNLLRKLEPELRRQFRLRRFGYFGSFARNEQTETSDIDVLIEPEDDDDWNVRSSDDLQNVLEQQAKREIQVVRTSQLRSEYKDGILEDARFLQDGVFTGGYDFATDPQRKVHRMKRYDVYLEEIIQAAKKIAQFVDGMTLEKYRSYPTETYAIERNLEIIGEAAKKLSREIKDRYPEIPWADWQTLRNILAHEYSNDNTAACWQKIHDTILPNRETLRDIYEKEKLG